jgi:hypothetical protein
MEETVKRYFPVLACLLLMAALAEAVPPRWAPDAKGGGRQRICLYRVAPGKHLEFLRWQTIQDEVAKEAGVPVPQLYAHIDGDAWDFLLIAPVTTAEQDQKLDAIAARRGLKTGFPAVIEFRQFLTWHTDTLAAGPTTAAELVAAGSK